MLGKLPASVGRVLGTHRAGIDKILYYSITLGGLGRIELVSPTFLPDSPMPARVTRDGIGISPALEWRDVPLEATELVLIVEDADSPTADPLVHAIAVDIHPRLRGLEEGDIVADVTGQRINVGRNSFLRRAWLPPDPPPGHGVHRYAFQIFALLPGDDFSTAPGRKELTSAIRQRAIGSGLLIGTYQR